MTKKPTIQELDELLEKRHGWTIGVEFKLQDMWIGVYWKRTGSYTDVWVCLVPCFPIHITWWWSR